MKPQVANLVLTGAIIMGFLIAGMFFRHFWRLTHERLFGLFAGAFCVMAVERIALIVVDPDNEFAPYVYLLRLAAFGLIVIGIVDKNRRD